MRDNKDFDGQKLEAAEIHLTVSNPFLRWLDNFWYHHKWKVIIIAFFAVVLTIGIVQIVNKDEIDMQVTVATHATLSAEERQGVRDVLVSLMPGDKDGDGAKNLQLNTYVIYSEDEMKAANEAETNEDGKYITYVDQSYNYSQSSDYRDYLSTGECTVMLVSQYLYEQLAANDRIRPMSDIFTEGLPDGVTSDGRGIYLSSTYAYEFFDELGALPEDTVICILRPYIFGASSKEDRYAYAVEHLKNIVEFSE